MEKDFSDGQGRQHSERRRNPHLRDWFDNAYAMIEPFFEQAAGWAGRPLEYLASRVLRENFPQFSAEEVHALVVSAHRVYIARNPDGSNHLARPDELKRSF